MNIEEKLTALGIYLTETPKPLGSYVPCVQSGALLFLSGVLPLCDGKLIWAGKVGDALTLEDGRQAARQSAINALSVLKSHLGSLDRIKQCVKVNGYIASAPSFSDHPKVLNGCSDLLFEVFGEAGRHARAALGVASLPLDAPVEIDFIFEIAPE
ncbi:MAG TPA: RidA family protein [Dissulfurispiraceae bacterium]|nr:RidA family protein [Dissulfurispiraceae bacterium]